MAESHSGGEVSEDGGRRCASEQYGVDVRGLPAGELVERIVRAIEASGGGLPFETFMAMALYEPGLGYYESWPDRVGRNGDFFTSVSVGPVFGQLLAFQFSLWIEGKGTSGDVDGSAAIDGPVDLVEAGAHDGSLARDVLDWLMIHRPEMYGRVRYIIVEPSDLRRSWQKEMLKTHVEKVAWWDSLNGKSVCGVIFGNELLDAFPVIQLAWNRAAEAWNTVCVAWEAGRFVWRGRAALQHEVAGIPAIPSDLKEVLPDGFKVEWSPKALLWWNTAAMALRRGRLMTLDYGMGTWDRFAPHRAGGTLRGYRGHRYADDILDQPGQTDLTAHVDFDAIKEEGRRAGLTTEHLNDQRLFLTRLFQLSLKQEALFEEWTSARVRQFQTLTHPEHLGRAFRVLVQTR